VGNTRRGGDVHREVTVHPHIRGEYSIRKSRTPSLSGSSPHPWGILSSPNSFLWMVRFIPTSVGNTSMGHTCIHTHSVHPHIRGEYDSRRIASSRACGSSPHPWGIQGIYPLCQMVNRFIPTSVGNTTTIFLNQRLTAVHPHIRGEYMIDLIAVICFSGSSPHPWGIRK